MIVALSTILVLLAVPSLEQESQGSQGFRQTSPCPSVLTYDQANSVPGRWSGVINLSSDTTLYSLWINILFDDKVDMLGNWVGEVSTRDNKNFKIENTDMQLDAGSTVPLRFFVQYNPLKKPPRLLTIRLNGIEICNDAHAQNPEQAMEPIHNLATGPPRTIYKLDNNFIAPNNGTPLDRTIDEALKILQRRKNINSKGADGQPLCGKALSSTLVQDGKATAETLWPWQIALHQTQNVKDMYICGGTLVTARHVITAAHCVTLRSSKGVVDRHALAVFLGKHNLWTSIDGVQIGYVKQITVHPEYNPSTYSHDVAILELNQPLTYTDWVRPACLWPKNDTDLKKVIGKKGLLIGWSYDDKGELINDLRQEEVPVISQAMCISSHERFMRFTSRYTYCAGNRDDKSPCASGGSGMVIKHGSTWYLRGLVSLGIPGYGKKRCDPTHYFVFTDLAKFLPWIYDNVFDF